MQMKSRLFRAFLNASGCSMSLSG